MRRIVTTRIAIVRSGVFLSKSNSLLLSRAPIMNVSKTKSVATVSVRGLIGLTPNFSKMYPPSFNWSMLAINSVSTISNMFGLKCVFKTFNSDETLYGILTIDGVASSVCSLLSAVVHGLSGVGYLKGKVKCSLMLMATMIPFTIGTLCSLIIAAIRYLTTITDFRFCI